MLQGNCCFIPYAAVVHDCIPRPPPHTHHTHLLPLSSTQAASFGRYNNYSFGLSPRGNGIDSYRTWEMLASGMIPIVLTSSIDRLYAGLPVLILHAWTELCDVDLEAVHRRLHPLFGMDLPHRSPSGCCCYCRFSRFGLRLHADGPKKCRVGSYVGFCVVAAGVRFCSDRMHASHPVGTRGILTCSRVYGLFLVRGRWHRTEVAAPELCRL